MEQNEQSNATYESVENIELSLEEVQQQRPSTQEPSQQHAMSEEYKKKCEQIINEFHKAFQEFKQDSENSNSEEFDRNLDEQKQKLREVDEEELPNQKIQYLFRNIGSVKLIINQKVVPLQACLFQQGDYFYEGVKDYMFIYSEANKSFYEGQVKKISDHEYRYHGMGKLLFGKRSEGFQYIGQFEDGKRHGRGRMTTKLATYEGEFKNDYMHGFGRQTIYKRKKKGVPKPIMVPQYIYQGQFKEGYREGEGQQIKLGTKSSSYKFTGQWKRNQKCGKGKIAYNNEDTYEGDWQFNVFNGEGVYIQYGNCTYKGQFKDGKYHGIGVMTYDNGDRYQGEFETGKKHGKGKYDWKQKNGEEDYYDGEWRNDSAQGNGTSMIQGQFYVGEFKNGKRHGEGQLNTVDGDLIRAIWDDGVMIKQIERNGQPVED